MANAFDQFDATSQGNAFDQFDAPKKKADPKIGQPEDLSFAERYVAPFLDRIGSTLQADQGPAGQIARGVLNNGNLRGSAIGGLMQGAADPGAAIVQKAANLVSPLVSDQNIEGPDNSLASFVNRGIQSEEQKYQEARQGAGRSGLDIARVAGNAGITAPLGGLGGAPASLLGVVGKGALVGGASGALQPITNGGENFWKDTAKDVGVGALAGAGSSALLGALARIVSPKASVNPDLQALQEAGVKPSIGQALGGAANAAEEKLQSLPFMGDAIRSMRAKAVEDFNNAAINRATKPIGVKISGSGQEAVAAAGDALSNAYDTALSKVNHVNFDTPQFNQHLGELKDMAGGLTSEMGKKFDRTLEQIVLRKMSPNGSILGSDLKAVDSELGKIASKWSRSSTASEQEFGDAVKQLQAIVRNGVATANPEYAAAQKAADTGWANLVRVEGASKAAINNGGVFSPAQLNSAVRSADHSVRDRATARGEALMQDLSGAGQKVLGNRVPNSGTADRALLIGAALGAPVSVPAGLVGAAAYSKPVQNALVTLLTKRPGQAPAVANYLRMLAGPSAVASAQLTR